MRLASAGRVIGTAIAGVAVLATIATAQPLYFPSVSVGAAAIYSGGGTLPSLAAGLSGSLDLVTDDRVTIRGSATGSAPIEHQVATGCIDASASACAGSAQQVSQLVSITGDVAFRPFGSDAPMAVVTRVGQYRATPAQGDGGAVSGLVYGLGVERDFGDDTPRFRVSLHALQFHGVYQQHPWGLVLGLSAVLPR